jgi:hypothetical protein
MNLTSLAKFNARKLADKAEQIGMALLRNGKRTVREQRGERVDRMLITHPAIIGWGIDLDFVYPVDYDNIQGYAVAELVGFQGKIIASAMVYVGIADKAHWERIAAPGFAPDFYPEHHRGRTWSLNRSAAGM